MASMCIAPGSGARFTSRADTWHSERVANQGGSTSERASGTSVKPIFECGARLGSASASTSTLGIPFANPRARRCPLGLGWSRSRTGFCVEGGGGKRVSLGRNVVVRAHAKRKKQRTTIQTPTSAQPLSTPSLTPLSPKPADDPSETSRGDGDDEADGEEMSKEEEALPASSVLLTPNSSSSTSASSPESSGHVEGGVESRAEMVGGAEEGSSSAQAVREKVDEEDDLNMAKALAELSNERRGMQAAKEGGWSSTAAFWKGVVDETMLIEWPTFGKVVQTTTVVVGMIVGSSAVLLTVNGIFAQLADKVFKDPEVGDAVRAFLNSQS